MFGFLAKTKNFVFQSICNMNIETNPMEEQPQKSWIRTSVTFKMLMIGALALLMLVPANMVQLIVYERESTGRAVETEVEQAWAGEQLVAGPILIVPYYKKMPNGEKKWHNKNFLPATLSVNGNMQPEKLKRSIYEITVYDAQLDVNGAFDLQALQNAQFDGTPQWHSAYLAIGISDMSGIQNNIKVNINNTAYAVKSGLKTKTVGESGITVPFVIDHALLSACDFNFKLLLQGTGSIQFLPLGNNTSVNITSPWATPGFTGAFSPDDKNINTAGFTSNWEILELNRNYPQVWDDDLYNAQMQHSVFGVDLVNTADDYQKTIRSVKYAILTIGLTFLVFFLIEIINKKKIHPFQYSLVGLALCLFYVLLLSLSEHIDFNLAYLISAAVVIAMITLYSLAVFKIKKLSAVLMLILSILYGYLFVTLQASDYALLLGSAGLVIMLSLTMYLTRNINWYTTEVGTA